MKLLDLGVDGTALANNRGFGRYCRMIVRTLVAADSEVRVTLYTDEDPATLGFQDHANLRVAPSGARLTDGARLNHGLSRPIVSTVRLAARVTAAHHQAFLFPTSFSFYPVCGTPLAIGLHDTTGLAMPREVHRSRASALAWRVKETAAVRMAALIFTISESARVDVCSAWNLSESRVPVVPNVPEPCFRPRGLRTQKLARRVAGLSSDEPFFLYVGGVNPHKDVPCLVHAFARVQRSGSGARAKLVIVGARTDEYVSANQSLDRAIEAERLGGSVLLTGLVDDETLAGLYSATTAFVSASRAEGFGLPAVEAARCAAPCLISDIPVNRENLRDRAAFFTIGDAGALTTLMEQVLCDNGYRRRLGQAGHSQVSTKRDTPGVSTGIVGLVQGIARADGGSRASGE